MPDDDAPHGFERLADEMVDHPVGPPATVDSLLRRVRTRRRRRVAAGAAALAAAAGLIAIPLTNFGDGDGDGTDLVAGGGTGVAEASPLTATADAPTDDETALAPGDVLVDDRADLLDDVRFLPGGATRTDLTDDRPSIERFAPSSVVVEWLGLSCQAAIVSTTPGVVTLSSVEPGAAGSTPCPSGAVGHRVELDLAPADEFDADQVMVVVDTRGVVTSATLTVLASLTGDLPRATVGNGALDLSWVESPCLGSDVRLAGMGDSPRLDVEVRDLPTCSAMGPFHLRLTLRTPVAPEVSIDEMAVALTDAPSETGRVASIDDAARIVETVDVSEQGLEPADAAQLDPSPAVSFVGAGTVIATWRGSDCDEVHIRTTGSSPTPVLTISSALGADPSPAEAPRCAPRTRWEVRITIAAGVDPADLTVVVDPIGAIGAVALTDHPPPGLPDIDRNFVLAERNTVSLGADVWCPGTVITVTGPHQDNPFIDVGSGTCAGGETAKTLVLTTVGADPTALLTFARQLGDARDTADWPGADQDRWPDDPGSGYRWHITGTFRGEPVDVWVAVESGTDEGAAIVEGTGAALGDWSVDGVFTMIEDARRRDEPTRVVVDVLIGVPVEVDVPVDDTRLSVQSFEWTAP